MKKKAAVKYALVILCLIFGLILHVHTINERSNRINNRWTDPGDAYSLIYHATVIEIKTDNSLIVEILPNFLAEAGISQRERADSLIAGDVVEAVYNSENEYMIKFLKRIEAGNVVDIKFYNRVDLAFDFSTTPIVVNCDGIVIYDETGKNIISELGF